VLLNNTRNTATQFTDEQKRWLSRLSKMFSAATHATGNANEQEQARRCLLQGLQKFGVETEDEDEIAEFLHRSTETENAGRVVVFTKYARTTEWIANLATYTCRLFGESIKTYQGLQTLPGTEDQYFRLVFYGHLETAEMAGALFAQNVDMLVDLAPDAIKSLKGNTVQLKNSYCHGAVTGYSKLVFELENQRKAYHARIHSEYDQCVTRKNTVVVDDEPTETLDQIEAELKTLELKITSFKKEAAMPAKAMESIGCKLKTAGKSKARTHSQAFVTGKNDSKKLSLGNTGISN